MNSETNIKRGFADEEFENRTLRAQEIMHEYELDGILLTTPQNIRYFTGYDSQFWESPTRPWFVIVPLSAKPIAIVPEIGASEFNKTWLDEIKTWPSPRPEDEGVSLLKSNLENVKKTFEDITGFLNPDYALDGCSAPNFACSIQSLAKAMAVFANPENLQKNRIMSIAKLKNAVLSHPELIAGSDRLCTKIMKKSNGRLIVKVGAEGVYTAMLLDKGLGMALKISDGSKRAAECLIITLLVMLGYFKKDDQDFLNYLNTPIYNWSEKKTGVIRASDMVWAKGNFLDI